MEPILVRREGLPQSGRAGRLRLPRAAARILAYAARVRIIAGEFRGRRFAPPRGSQTRPMLDRVREAMFSTLADWIPDARVLDLFAGTGSLGLEALSRGASHVRFVEQDRAAFRLLTGNLEEFGVADRTSTGRGDALDERLWFDAAAADAPFDVVLVDPPYPLWRERQARARLLAAVEGLVERALGPAGTLVLHTHPRDLAETDLPTWVEIGLRKYGRTALWYLWKYAPGADEEDA